MFSKKTLLEEIDKNYLDFTQEQIEELHNSDSCVVIFRKIIFNLQKSQDESRINFFNKMLVKHLSGGGNRYSNCHKFIKEADNVVWSYVLDNFDDDKINTLIVVIYLTLSKVNVCVEYI